MSVIVWPEQSALQKHPADLIQAVKKALIGRVEAAYIFGSLALMIYGIFIRAWTYWCTAPRNFRP